MLKPTKSIEEGLKEFTKKQCLKALELSQSGLKDDEIAYKILPKGKLKGMKRSEIIRAGRRMVGAGRYIKFSFKQ